MIPRQGICFLFALLTLPLFSLSSIEKSNRESKDFAIFFANDDYKGSGWKDLKNPVKDAQRISKELGELYGFTCQIYANQTKAEIRKHLIDWQNKSFGEDDQLLVFFSGHGDFNDQSNKGFFIPKGGKSTTEDPFNDSHLDLTEIGNIISLFKCPHILLAIDACYSGTIVKEIAFGDKSGEDEPGRKKLSYSQLNRVMDNELAGRSRLILTSGGKERTPDGRRHSPFTEGILKALQLGYTTGNGLMTWNSLLSVMDQVSPKPREGKLNGHQRGGFVFVYKDAFEPEESSAASDEIEVAFFEAENCGTPACYREFLKEYGSTEHPFVALVSAKLQSSKKETTLPPEMSYFSPDSLSYTYRAVDVITAKRYNKSVHIETASFEVSLQPVTVAQFSAFVSATGYITDAEKSGGSICNGDQFFSSVNWRCDSTGKYIPKSKYDEIPVVHVSWNDARAYCEWLGTAYRLPLEKEWAYLYRKKKIHLPGHFLEWVEGSQYHYQTEERASDKLFSNMDLKLRCGIGRVSTNNTEMPSGLYHDHRAAQRKTFGHTTFRVAREVKK